MKNSELGKAYDQGFKDAVKALAIWKDGKQTVGVSEHHLQDVLENPSQYFAFSYLPPKSLGELHDN